MAWTFTPEAKARLETCHPALKAVVYRAQELSPIDFTVLEGHRDKAAQEKAFAEGKSKLHWPNGNHNTEPSNAVDLAPLPINWGDPHPFVLLCGVVIASAKLLGVKIRWGGNWAQDWNLATNKFSDLPHYELTKDNEGFIK